MTGNIDAVPNPQVRGPGGGLVHGWETEARVAPPRENPAGIAASVSDIGHKLIAGIDAIPNDAPTQIGNVARFDGFTPSPRTPTAEISLAVAAAQAPPSTKVRFAEAHGGAARARSESALKALIPMQAARTDDTTASGTSASGSEPNHADPGTGGWYLADDLDDGVELEWTPHDAIPYWGIGGVLTRAVGRVRGHDLVPAL